MIETDPVEAVLQGEDTLNFVRLDHAGEHVAYRDRFAGPRKIVGHGENAAQVVRRVPPLRGQPGIVEIEPANHGADVESGVDGIELVSRAGNARAVGEGRTRNHRAHQLRAGRIFQRLKSARQGIHETVAGGLIGEFTLDLEAQCIVCYRGQDVIRRGTFGRFDIVGHEGSRTLWWCWKVNAERDATDVAPAARREGSPDRCNWRSDE